MKQRPWTPLTHTSGTPLTPLDLLLCPPSGNTTLLWRWINVVTTTCPQWVMLESERVNIAFRIISFCTLYRDRRKPFTWLESINRCRSRPTHCHAKPKGSICFFISNQILSFIFAEQWMDNRRQIPCLLWYLNLANGLLLSQHRGLKPSSRPAFGQCFMFAEYVNHTSYCSGMSYHRDSVRNRH